MSMSDLRDMTNNGNSDIAIKKNELKNFLEKYFRTLFNFICQKVKTKKVCLFLFTQCKWYYQYNSFIRLFNSFIKAAAVVFRKTLLKVDLGLDDRSFDPKELREFLTKTQIQGILLTLTASYFWKELFHDKEEGYLESSRDQDNKMTLRMKAIFQFMFYQVTHGRTKIPLHILYAHTIYKQCYGRELITTFNKQCCSVSCKSMKNIRIDLEKFTILKNERIEDGVPWLIHFITSCFTNAVFDNFFKKTSDFHHY